MEGRDWRERGSWRRENHDLIESVRPAEKPSNWTTKHKPDSDWQYWFWKFNHDNTIDKVKEAVHKKRLKNTGKTILFDTGICCSWRAVQWWASCPGRWGLWWGWRSSRSSWTQCTPGTRSARGHWSVSSRELRWYQPETRRSISLWSQCESCSWSTVSELPTQSIINFLIHNFRITEDYQVDNDANDWEKDDGSLKKYHVLPSDDLRELVRSCVKYHSPLVWGLQTLTGDNARATVGGVYCKWNFNPKNCRMSSYLNKFLENFLTL